MISEFPLFLFTTLAGLGGGTYALSALFPVGNESKRKWLFPFICGALLLVGLVSLPFDLGRPERMFNAFTHPESMIAEEAYWSIGLGIVILIDFIITAVKKRTYRILRIIGAILALGLMVVMGMAYFELGGIAGWPTWQTFLLFIFGDLAMGVTLVAVFENKLPQKGSFFAVEVVLALLAAVAFLLEVINFAEVTISFVLMIVALAVAVVTVICMFVLRKGKPSAQASTWIVFILMLASVAIARYGFYAASTV